MHLFCVYCYWLLQACCIVSWLQAQTHLHACHQYFELSAQHRVCTLGVCTCKPLHFGHIAASLHAPSCVHMCCRLPRPRLMLTATWDDCASHAPTAAATSTTDLGGGRTSGGCKLGANGAWSLVTLSWWFHCLETSYTDPRQIMLMGSLAPVQCSVLMGFVWGWYSTCLRWSALHESELMQFVCLLHEDMKHPR